MTRVIVHAGFHKTGTSTVQRALRAHRARLAPLWQVGLEEDFPDAAASARAWSVGGDPVDLGLFQGLMADWLAARDLAGARGLVLSCESLAGEIPGRIGGCRDYRGGTVLLPALIAAIRAVLGPVAVDVHLSTRAAEDWLDSLHWQLVRGGAVDEDHAPFTARMRPHADLAVQARAIGAAIAPDRLTIAALEDGTGPEGPLAPLFDLMGLPPGLRAGWGVTAANARPPGIDRIALADRFAAINRASPSRDAARTRKRAIMARIWADGGERALHV